MVEHVLASLLQCDSLSGVSRVMGVIQVAWLEFETHPIYWSQEERLVVQETMCL